MKSIISTLLTLECLLALAGCGQSGPLYLPQQPQATGDNKTTQVASPNTATTQNQTIQAQQPYAAPTASYLVPKDPSR